MEKHVTGLWSMPGDAGNWCGPTAMAAVTGISPFAVEQEVLKHRAAVGNKYKSRKTNGQAMRSTFASEVEPVLGALGTKATLIVNYRNDNFLASIKKYNEAAELHNYSVRRLREEAGEEEAVRFSRSFRMPPKPRMTRGMDTFEDWHARNRNVDALFLILVKGHMLAYSGGYIVDSTTGREPVMAFKYRGLRQHILKVWRIEK
jgi:hypothetical protein